MANEKPFCMFSYGVIPFLRMAESETEKAYYFDLFLHYVAVQKPEYEEPAEEPAKPEGFTDDRKSKEICRMIKNSLKEAESYYIETAAKEKEKSSIGGLKGKIQSRYPANDPPVIQITNELEERLKDLRNKRVTFEGYLEKWEVSAKEAVQNWEKSRADSLPVMPDNTNTFETLPKWFETFWGEYPAKTGRVEAEKAFNEVCNSETDFNEIMDGLRCLNREDYQHREAKFIPNPAKWLKEKRWNDEPKPPAKGKHVPSFIHAQERGEFDNEEAATQQEIDNIRKHIGE